VLDVETKESTLAIARRYAAGPAGALRSLLTGDVRLTLAILILTTIIILAIFAPLIAPFDPEEPLRSGGELLRLQPPSREHIFGTDVNNMDIFSRIIFAPRVDLLIAAVSVAVSLVAGSVLGLLGGYFMGQRSIGGVLAELLNRLMDIIQSFPIFIVALAMVGVLGEKHTLPFIEPRQGNVILILSILFTPVFFRFVRGEVLPVRELLFVESAIAVGNPRWRLLFKHILPNSVTPALIQASVNMGFAILLTAGLSFVGAGVRPPTPEWGAMINVGKNQMVTGQWWPSVFPGLFIGLTVFSLAIIGESLRVRLEQE